MCSKWFNSAAKLTGIRHSYPAAKNSASHSHDRWLSSPKCCCLTSPSPRSILTLRKQVRLELKSLQRRIGITFIFVTHDQEEALSLSDTIALLNRGRSEQIGTPEELYLRPADRVRRKFPRQT